MSYFFNVELRIDRLVESTQAASAATISGTILRSSAMIDHSVLKFHSKAGPTFTSILIVYSTTGSCRT